MVLASRRVSQCRCDRIGLLVQRLFLVRPEVGAVVIRAAQASGMRSKSGIVDGKVDVRIKPTKCLFRPVAQFLVTQYQCLLPKHLVFLQLPKQEAVKGSPQTGSATNLLPAFPQRFDRTRNVVADVYGTAVETELEMPDPAHVREDSGVATLLLAEQAVLLCE